LQITLIFVLFFLSGFSALIYEVSWVRLLGLVLGSSAQATACVLSCFLGGLALGALLGGRVSDRVNISQLRAYGIAEIIIAVTGILAVKALQSMPDWFAAWQGALPVDPLTMLLEQVAVSTIVLLIPTIFMGATLPLLSRYVSMTERRTKHFFAQLYTLNTLGAVVGSLFAAFVGFSYLGINGTAWSAAALNIIVGTGALLLSNRSAMSATLSEQAPSALPSSEDLTGGRYRYLLLIAGLCGFTSLAYEVLWTRFLRAFITSSTYAFTFMVSVFLLGLVFGSVLYMRWLSARTGDTFVSRLRILAIVQFLIAITSQLSLILLPGALALKAAFLQVPDPNYTNHVWLLYDALNSLLFMLVPATLIGVCFPLIGELALYKPASIGSSVGNIYAANTVGCILGSALAGLVMIPLIGSERAFFVVSAVTLLIGYMSCLEVPRSIVAKGLYLTPLLLFLVFLHFIHADYIEWSFAKLNASSVLKYAEDSVCRAIALQQNDTKKLVINGENYSSDRMNARRYMRSIAEIPTLLTQHPIRELVICFGVGNTAHMLELNPDVEHLDICELSQAVISCEPVFRATNGNVLGSRKVTVHLTDGRNFLLRSKEMYDVISLEPPPPQDAGIVNLYTREFYRIAHDHLTPDGKLCQWVPLHAIQTGLCKMALQAGRSEFNWVSLWIPNNSEALMVCSKEPLVFDCKKIQERIDAHPQEKACLAEVGLEDACHILSTLVLSGKGLDDYLSNVQPVTDDRPQLEFFLTDQTNRPYPTDIPQNDVHLSDDSLGITIKNCNREKLELNRKAMRLLYEVDTNAVKDKEQGIKAAAETRKLLPDNKFVQWTNEHPGYH
jgi:spermidine synthase